MHKLGAVGDCTSSPPRAVREPGQKPGKARRPDALAGPSARACHHARVFSHMTRDELVRQPGALVNRPEPAGERREGWSFQGLPARPSG